MNPINVRDLFSLDEKSLWEQDDRFEPLEQIEIVMDGTMKSFGGVDMLVDGQVVKTTYRETIISWYLWDLHRLYPKTPILSEHHIGYFKFDGRLFPNVLTNIAKDIYNTYGSSVDLELLAKQIYEVMNRIYNICVTKLGAYVDTMDANDYVDVLYHPDVVALREKCIADPTPRAIRLLNEKLPELVAEPGFLPGNSLVDSMVIKSTPIMQINQCVGIRGKTTDLNSYMFPNTITESFGTGIKNIVNFIQESRSGTKALIFQKEPIKATEYFNRRLQILNQSIQHIFPGDCGTTNTLPWHIQPGDINPLNGKYYYDDDGKLQFIERKDGDKLMGKTIRLRSPLMCKHKHLGGVCETCLGRLSYTLPYGTNIGHVAAYTTGEEITQKVLSVKHLDASTEIKDIDLDAADMKYIRLSSQRSEVIKFNKNVLSLSNPKLVLRVEDVANLTQAMSVNKLSELSVFRVSTIFKAAIKYDYDSDGQVMHWLTVSGPSRPSSLTVQFLEYIRKVGYTQEDSRFIEIPLEGWDYNLPAFILPQKQVNMLDFMKQVSHMLECGPKEGIKRGLDPSNPDDVVTYLRTILEYMSQHISVNIMYLEVTTLALTVKNLEEGDFRIADDDYRRDFASAATVMHYRSIGPALAYEEQANVILNALTFNRKNRVGHPMDSLFMQNPDANLYKQWVYR